MLIRPSDNCWKSGSCCWELFQFLWNSFKTARSVKVFLAWQIWALTSTEPKKSEWLWTSGDSLVIEILRPQTISTGWELIPVRGDFNLASVVWSPCNWGCISAEKISCLSLSLLNEKFISSYWHYIPSVSVLCLFNNQWKLGCLPHVTRCDRQGSTEVVHGGY